MAFASTMEMPSRREQDEQLVALALQHLEQQGSIEFVGEYRDELMKFVPFLAWLKANNHLVGRKVITYSGMRPYYFFLADEEYAEKQTDRQWQGPSKQFTWPGTRTATERPAPWPVYP